jgi:hypothetical protein
MQALGLLFMEVADATDREARHTEAFDQMAEQMQSAVAAAQAAEADDADVLSQRDGQGDETIVPPTPQEGDARP